MSPADIAVVEKELGKGVLKGNTLTIYKTYDHEGTIWALPIVEEKALENLVERFALNAEESAGHRRCQVNGEGLGSVAGPCHAYPRPRRIARGDHQVSQPFGSLPGDRHPARPHAKIHVLLALRPHERGAVHR